MLSLEKKWLWSHLTAALGAYGEVTEKMELGFLWRCVEVGQKTGFKRESFRLGIRRNVFPMRTVRWRLRLPKGLSSSGDFRTYQVCPTGQPHGQHQLGPETSPGSGQPALLRLQLCVIMSLINIFKIDG